VVGVSAAAAGKPVDASFVLFGLGFLLLVVGGVLLGVGVWRARVVPSGATPLWVGAAAALVAIVVFTDPWHDIGLFVFAGAWSALGVTLLTARRCPPNARIPPQPGQPGQPEVRQPDCDLLVIPVRAFWWHC